MFRRLSGSSCQQIFLGLIVALIMHTRAGEIVGVSRSVQRKSLAATNIFLSAEVAVLRSTALDKRDTIRILLVYLRFLFFQHNSLATQGLCREQMSAVFKINAFIRTSYVGGRTRLRRSPCYRIRNDPDSGCSIISPLCSRAALLISSPINMRLRCSASADALSVTTPRWMCQETVI